MTTRKVLAVFFAFLFTAVAWGQNATTSVRGTITDSTGAVLPMASVTITNKTTHQAQTVNVGKKGEYTFVDLDPDTYEIKATSDGFNTVVKNAELLVSQPATINFALGVGKNVETVEVTAASTLNFTDASVGNAIDGKQIEAMPIDSRNVADLLSLQPGVLYFATGNSNSNPAATNDSRLGAVAGARSDQGNITLDGLDDNDQTFGYAFTGVLRSTLDSTEQYRVTTSSANADSGRSSGAQVTLVTKAGTNAFHGSAYEYWRNRYFAANDWFTKKAQVASGQPNKPGQLTRNTFGGTIGGPIKKDKLFFFFNYEGQRTRESATVTQAVPTDSYRAGILKYKDTAGNVDSISMAQLAQLDSPCTANGVCPNGPGANAAVLAYFAQLPHNNGLTTGDGLNEGTFAFSSPTPYSHNTSILKFDWTPGSAHRVFVRGNLQKDVISSAQQFPGLPPSSQSEDNTKGIAAGDTWTITSHLVNDLRYGYTRQGIGTAGLGTTSYVDFRSIATPTAETRNTIRSVPMNSIVETLSYTKGNHSLQIGGTWRLIHNNSKTDANSWSSGNSNPLGLTSLNLPDPSTLGTGYLPVQGAFSSNYLLAYANIVGTTPILTHNINYKVDPGGSTGSLLSVGAPVVRNFVSDEYEYYVQDIWRATSKLTMTFGLRHSLLGVPYDVNGQSAAPTIDTHAFFAQRGAAAAQGLVYEPALAFAPNGPVYGRPGYWSKQKINFAPRFSMAYALNSKTSIRAGAGMYYDHFGQGVVNAFNTSGSFGLASNISSQLGLYNVENSPRFVGRTTLPNLPVSSGSPTTTFPFVLAQTLAQNSAFGISWGVDNKLKTPYSEVYNVSIQRALPSGFTLEVDYVGHFGRKLMQQLDLATPTNLVDPKSGTSYFQAGAQLAAVVDANGGNGKATVAAIPYFENMFPQLAGKTTKACPTAGQTATQAIYCNEWSVYRKVLGETTALADLDFYCTYTCPASAPTNRYFQGQFSSLYAWSSIGTSSYNAAQFVLRHPQKHGLQLDLSYTYGNSIDIGSDAERSSEKQGGSGSYITNAWNPRQSRGVSDFDTRHLITTNGSYLLPFGKGQAFGTHANRLTDLVIGGWRAATIIRWTSGLPFSLSEGGFTTDWEIASYGIQLQKFKANTVANSGNVPNAFGTTLANQITGSITSGGPLERLPYPGEAGTRNNLRKDGYFGADASLTKPFNITERHHVDFSWEVFNLSNSVRFNGVSGSLTSGTFGNYSSTLTTARRMQFSLRYKF